MFARMLASLFYDAMQEPIQLDTDVMNDVRMPVCHKLNRSPRARFELSEPSHDGWRAIVALDAQRALIKASDAEDPSDDDIRAAENAIRANIGWPAREW